MKLFNRFFKKKEPADIKSLIRKLSLKPRYDIELQHPEKSMAIQEIEKLGTDAKEFLLEALEGSDIEAKGSIIYLLSKFESERVAISIAKQLEDSNAKIRYEAITTLKNFSAEYIENQEVIDCLQKAASDENIDVRKTAEGILKYLGIETKNQPWFYGANTWEELANAFIRLEMQKQSPDYQGLAKKPGKFSGAEKHAVWVRVAGRLDTIDKLSSMRCYLEALYNDPDPDSIAWNWINGTNDQEMNIMEGGSRKTLESVEKLREKYKPITKT